MASLRLSPSFGDSLDYDVANNYGRRQGDTERHIAILFNIARRVGDSRCPEPPPKIVSPNTATASAARRIRDFVRLFISAKVWLG